MAGGGPGGDRAAEILTSQIARTHESPRRTLSHRPNARIEAPVIIGARESKVGAGRALALSWPFRPEVVGPFMLGEVALSWRAWVVLGGSGWAGIRCNRLFFGLQRCDRGGS